jgi:UDP-3-O-[3-hydroxymyristoyl] glucosamine N-acyltransferase
VTLSLGVLAERLGCELRGDPALTITTVAALERATPGTLAFLANPKLRRHLASTRASAVILTPDDAAYCTCAALISHNPHLSFARAAGLLHPEPAPAPGIHASAVVDTGARIARDASIGAQCVVATGVEIGAGCVIGPGCIIERGARIGAGSRLVARVTICHDVVIGARALILPGAVIGADGFGLARDGERWERVPQLGTVRIGDDVEVGANTTLDRGALEDTVIEDGVKLDNQIQIAHNVCIGAHTAIAGCVGIAGSATIGQRCTVGGGVGIAGHLNIADDVHITGMSFVTRSVNTPGLYSSGMPLETNTLWKRNMARLRRLDQLARRLHQLETTMGITPEQGHGDE